jgi:hypothetical protein
MRPRFLFPTRRGEDAPAFEGSVVSLLRAHDFDKGLDAWSTPQGATLRPNLRDCAVIELIRTWFR